MSPQDGNRNLSHAALASLAIAITLVLVVAAAQAQTYSTAAGIRDGCWPFLLI